MRHTALVLALALAAGPLPAQQPLDSATLARARAVLHHAPFAVAGWPIVSVEVRPTGPHALNDSVVIVQQRRDTLTLELTQGVDLKEAREGPLERCREMREYGTQELARNDCSSPRPYQTVEHVWLELRGPLPYRVRGQLLDHLVQLTWSPRRLRP